LGGTLSFVVFWKSLQCIDGVRRPFANVDELRAAIEDVCDDIRGDQSFLDKRLRIKGVPAQATALDDKLKVAGFKGKLACCPLQSWQSADQTIESIRPAEAKNGHF
jgi:hypothetical protein